MQLAQLLVQLIHLRFAVRQLLAKASNSRLLLLPLLQHALLVRQPEWQRRQYACC